MLLAAIEAVTRDPDRRPTGLVTRHTLTELAQAAPARPLVSGFAGRRVLVAEDNVTNQKVVMRMLEKLGCEVTLACDGAEAIDHAAHGGVDLVFMDMQMPGVDGLEATRAIRTMAGDVARVPIVALTANSMAHERQAALDSGMNGFVSKPVRREDIEKALSEYLPPDCRVAA